MNRKIWAVVPAAGVGTRLPGEVPKQYRLLGRQTILDHCLTRLLANSKVCGVMLALNANDCHWKHSAYASDARVRVCVGGAERADSVLAGLDALAEIDRGPQTDGAVLVHDAARALLPTEALQRLLAEAPGEHGAILALPAQDTLKWSLQGAAIEKTLDRSMVWQAQTPQYFQFQILREALRDALAAGISITDEASCMEWRGYHPRLVLGDALNFKITTVADLKIATVLMEAV